MFKKIGVRAKISKSINEIKDAEKILLPGVGAFDVAMNKINTRGLKEILSKKAFQDKIPILGICLGMQILTDRSEEGNLSGLGWISGEVRKFKFEAPMPSLKVPHMGWNTVKKVNSSPLVDGLQDDSRFYFVHSYYVKANNHNNVLMHTFYGHDFDSMITNGSNIFGAQFHPEKSHKFGMRLFKNFSSL